ncbi:MAG: glycosyltransferase [Niabella sp.]
MPLHSKKILFFGPFTYRAIDNESLMLQFKQMGHDVYFLTMEAGTYIIPELEKYGVKCFKLDIKGAGKFSLLKKVIFLVRFIRKHNIDIIFSHLEPANFLITLAQSFVKSKIVIVRHHSDLFYINGLHTMFSYRYAYKKTKHVIAISNYSKEIMVEKEEVDADKISVIPLSFNFDLFTKPDINVVKQIRQLLGVDLLLLSVGRLVHNKRLDIAVKVLNQLRNKGINAGLLILGQGELEQSLQQLITENNLSDYCKLLGYKTNVMDYLAACDILLHPSESEASSLIIKEAGLQKKVIIGCADVGDCGEYIINGENGFLREKNSYLTQSVEIIKNELMDLQKRIRVGENLYKTINDLYSINNNIGHYDKFLK